jgi:tRNA modification GTPase
MDTQNVKNTIFALASGSGKSGIAVFRISGPSAQTAYQILSKKPTPKPRQVTKARLYRPMSDEVLDDGLVIYFAAPASFTGEDVIELHIHGGMAVIAGLSEALNSINDVRLADAGEFTRRAFDNGKFDLTAAEGLADLINAETLAQKRQAQRQLRGELGAIYKEWRSRLIKATALFEAEIDFSDEDLPPGLIEEVSCEVLDINDEIIRHLDDKNQGEIVRNGFHIAIIGPPNAGKSSVLNRLSNREAAIVSEKAGTTRDVIEVRLELDGYPIILADTAGLREVDDEIESEGIRRAEERATKADLKLAVFDGASWPEMDRKTQTLVDDDTVVLINKSDLLKHKENSYPVVSSITGQGFENLLNILKTEVFKRCDVSASPALTRTRHRTALMECRTYLERFQAASETELKAEDLRMAARALGQITGQVNVEEVLDVIFGEFCIGK